MAVDRETLIRDEADHRGAAAGYWEATTRRQPTKLTRIKRGTGQGQIEQTQRELEQLLGTTTESLKAQAATEAAERKRQAGQSDEESDA